MNDAISECRRQAGVTLVELLVAMLVSLILIGGVVEVFLSSKRTYRLQDTLARLQEEGRFAIEILNRDLRLAGYPQNALPAIDAFPELTSLTVTGLPTSHAAWEGGDDDPLSDPREPDQLIVQYEANPSTASVTRDCLGGIVGPGGRVVNWYFVDDDGAAPDGLACVGSTDGDGPAQVLIENVTDLQITYGVDQGSATLDGSPNRYYGADAVPDWNAVMAVRVQLAIDPVANDDTGTPLPPRVFSTTLPIRNNLP